MTEAYIDTSDVDQETANEMATEIAALAEEMANELPATHEELLVALGMVMEAVLLDSGEAFNSERLN